MNKPLLLFLGPGPCISWKDAISPPRMLVGHCWLGAGGTRLPRCIQEVLLENHDWICFRSAKIQQNPRKNYSIESLKVVFFVVPCWIPKKRDKQKNFFVGSKQEVVSNKSLPRNDHISPQKWPFLSRWFGSFSRDMWDMDSFPGAPKNCRIPFVFASMASTFFGGQNFFHHLTWWGLGTSYGTGTPQETQGSRPLRKRVDVSCGCLIRIFF